MGIRRLHPACRYSEAVIYNGTVYLAGQLADNIEGDIRQQTRETLANIDRFLADAGTHKSRILSATIYLRDIDNHYSGMNDVWDAWIPEGAAPARVCVEARLYVPQVLVEISVVAALP